MDTARFGRTNLMVSRIGFGGMTIPRVDKPQAVATVNRALDLGVNFIDTARAYGDSEEKIGEVMKTRRAECFLSSRSITYDYEGMRQAIDTSLRTLHTECIDIYEVHDVSTAARYERAIDKDGAIRALCEAREQGKTRFIGCTGHDWQILEKLIQTGVFDVALIAYNLADREVERSIVDLARDYDVGLFVMKVLGNGRLLRQTALDSNRQPTVEECLRFALSNKDLPLVLTGADCPAEIEENVGIADRFVPLTPEEDRELRAFGDHLRRGYCYNCNYCLPCPAEIDIPAILRLVEAKERRNWHTVHPGLKTDYATRDRTIAHCTDCGQCEDRCPQKLPVREKLKQAEEMLAGSA
jgi:predicted aldo/keto reductase-like oxidoreductase